MNDMFCAKSVCDRGTLFFIKNRFGHRSVKKNVMENSNHVYNLLTFTVEGLVCLLALQLLNLENLDDEPSNMESPAAFHDLCSRLVDIIWPKIDEASIAEVMKADGTPDDDMEPEDAAFLCLCKIPSSDGRLNFNFKSSQYIMIQCVAKNACN